MCWTSANRSTLASLRQTKTIFQTRRVDSSPAGEEKITGKDIWARLPSMRASGSVSSLHGCRRFLILPAPDFYPRKEVIPMATTRKAGATVNRRRAPGDAAAIAARAVQLERCRASLWEFQKQRDPKFF